MLSLALPLWLVLGWGMTLASVNVLNVAEAAFGSTPFQTRRTRTTTRQQTTSRDRCLTSLWGVRQPFGEQEYWEQWYQNRSNVDDHNNKDDNGKNAGMIQKERGDFSWYASWEDIRPLFLEFLHNDLENTTSTFQPDHSFKMLLPGIGMDAALLTDMYQQDGFSQLYAMDYAPASIPYVQQRWNETLLCHRESNPNTIDTKPTLHTCVADVRELPYETGTFGAILDKGTLDAVYLCGSSPEEKRTNLQRGVLELQRVLNDGGLFWTLSGICADAIMDDSLNLWPPDEWELLANTLDSNIYTTSDGYTSNNVDGTMLVFRKKKKRPR